MEFVYHLKPAKLKGKSLLPLSKLEEKYPELHKQEVAKYSDRSEGPEKPIKCLNVKWKDVVNLSTINPILLLSVAELIGNETHPAVIFRIPISKLKNKPFCLFTDFDGKEKYEPMTVKEYRECHEIPAATIQHYLESKEEGEQPLVFEGVPHILVADEIDISDVEVIRYNPKNLFALASMFVSLTT